MNILIFNPLGGHNGAEVFLKNLVLHLPSAVTCKFYFVNKGKLSEQLSLTHTVIYPGSITSKFASIFFRGLQTFFGFDSEEHKLLRIHRKYSFDFWYINTINLHRYAFIAKRKKIPYLLHVHELPSMYAQMPAFNLKETIGGAKLVLACSEDVLKNARIMGARKAELFRGVVDISAIEKTEMNNKVREDLGIAADRFIWVMSGAPSYRKGIDYLPEISKAILNQGVILWLGYGNSGLRFFVEKQLEMDNLDNVIFMGERLEDYYQVLNQADGFILTSREDPFPLVMIEAAALGKPIVSFDSGGISEFLEDGMGMIVPNYNVERLIAAMKAVMNKSVELSPLTSKKRAREFDAKQAVTHWIDVMHTNL